MESARPRAALIGLVLTAAGTIAAIFTVPEFRTFVGLQTQEQREILAKDFLMKYLASSDTTRSDIPEEPEAISNYFHFPINNYYGERDISREALINSISEYHTRWPYRSYSVIDLPKVVSSEKVKSGFKLLTESSITYECRRPHTDKTIKKAKGVIHLRVELLLERQNKLTILSVYEFNNG
jgi:hypothetical protein